LAQAMTAVSVLLNRGGGAVARDPEIAGKVAEALKGAGVDADVELVEGGDCAVRCRAISERGDALLIVGGGDGTIGSAAASLRTLWRFGHRRLTLTINEEQKARVDTPLLFVGNNDYRIDLAAAGTRERLDGGELTVMVMRKKTRRGMIAASIRALFNRSHSDDMVRIDGVERLRVSSHRNHLAVSLDGEVVRAAPPLEYRIRRRALRVIAP